MFDSTVAYRVGGYDFVGMSASWKKLCLELPCSNRVVIPPVYATSWIETTIEGEPVLLQVWKGDCPHVLRGLPGGIGGEVGIYRRDNARKIPNVLDIPALNDFPAEIQPLVQRVAEEIIRLAIGTAESGTDRWWPFPMPVKMEMRFSHRDRPFFTVDPVEGDGTDPAYWLSRWMGYGSYGRYAISELPGLVPLRTVDYTMEFGVAGKWFRWDAPGSAIVPM
jgi:hypothetical protein